jgi:TonB-dependent SusC/RagA subfamily outer membrane receptor
MLIAARAAVPLALLLLACAPRAANRTPARDGSRVVITAADIERSPGQSLEQLLLAHVPGLYVTRARDGRTVLHLRGNTTLLGEEEPLFIVNGIPLGSGAGGNLSAINPRDIETVEVLRDAAATALYGVRGANGVIIITTKQS